MQHSLQIFEYEDRREFRTLEIDGEVWFFAIDVVNALEIKNPSDAYARLDADDLGQTEGVDKRGQKQVFRIVNEAGLYSLIFRSEKPEAKRFKRWVTHEVLPQIRKTGTFSLVTAKTPKFVRRFNENWDRVETGYFSIISELFIRVYGRLEQVGHIMADRGPDGKELRPDVAVGKRFPPWLEKYYPEYADDFTFYIHTTPEAEFPARQYLLRVLPVFIEFIETVWIPEHSEEYFKKRDPKALTYLPKLLPPPDKPRPGMTRRVT